MKLKLSLSIGKIWRIYKNKTVTKIWSFFLSNNQDDVKTKKYRYKEWQHWNWEIVTYKF